MKHPNDGHVNHDPGRVEERDEAIGGEQIAHRRHVAHAAGLGAVGRACGVSDYEVDHRRGQSLVDDGAEHVLQAVAHVVEQEQEQQRDGRATEQYHECFLAVAGQHAIEHLQHEDRGGEQQQVHEKRERGEVAQ